MVALSVSISARISPSFTVSPTFLSHEATVPSSMVSLNLGIVINSAPSGIRATSFDIETPEVDSSTGAS